MKIPPDATVIKNQSLTPIQIIRALYGPVVKGLGSDVKKVMAAKNAQYAESDGVTARIQGGGTRKKIDPKKFYVLAMNKRFKKLTLTEFFASISVNTEAAGQFLSEDEIKSISVDAGDVEPSLITEFKDGVALDIPRMQAAMVREFQEQLAPGDSPGVKCIGRRSAA